MDHSACLQGNCVRALLGKTVHTIGMFSGAIIIQISFISYYIHHLDYLHLILTRSRRYGVRRYGVRRYGVTFKYCDGTAKFLINATIRRKY